jgi:hypothetical protein
MEAAMFKWLKNKDKAPYIEKDGNVYDPDRVTVHYEGEVLSPEYAVNTLVFQEGGYKVRENFNDQPYEWHALFPHGRGKLIYRDQDDPDTIYEQYEGDFAAGQYHGEGTLVDRHGEVLEGTFEKNKYVG